MTVGAAQTLLTYSWTSGTDIYAGCTDPNDDQTVQYDAGKLQAISGPATVVFTGAGNAMTVTQSFMGQSFTVSYHKVAGNAGD